MKKATARLSARSTNIDFDAVYGTGYCIPLWLRDEQVKLSIKKVKGRVQHYDGKREDPIAIVGYGPSLKKTWEHLKDFKYIITTSGAHKFLIEKGIVPTWHLDVDPRDHKIKMLGDIHPDVTYLPCSTVHPGYIDTLIAANAKIELWHCFSNDAEALRVLPQGEYSLTGGCDAGMRAMSVARFMGFVNQHVFGMDGCAENEYAHADKHTNPLKQFFDLEYPKGSGRFFRTSPNLKEVAKTVPHEVDMLKLSSVKFYGEGLVQAMMQNHQMKAPKESNIAFLKPTLISDTYRQMNQKLHDEMGHFGAGGYKHAEVVLKLSEKLKTTSVLDYGCGKGTLAKNLPFPIWEYDPAISGKDMSPRPADIVVCTDVLEHIEPEMLGDVLANLASLTQKVGYFVISTRPAKKVLPDGRNAHLIQEGKDWWGKTLEGFFDIGQLFEKGDEVHAVVGPRTKKVKVEAPQAAVTVFEHAGTKVKFHTPNKQTAWRANTLATKEPVTLEWIDTFEKGEVLWDIGANVGGYTVLAAAHRGAKVYAFEPEASNYAILCQNITLNKLDATAYCLAIASGNPEVSTIYLSTQDAGGSCNSYGQEVGFDLQPRPGIKQGCLGMSIDTLIEMGIPAPDHIKIDVDGFEHRIIAGAVKALASGKVKSLLIEVNENLPDHQEMLKNLQTCGYEFDTAQIDAARRKDGTFKGCAEYVLRRPAPVNPVKEYVLQQIEAAEVIMEPYPHIYIENALPPEFLAQVTPADGAGYKSLQEARGTAGYPDRSVKDAPDCTAWMRDGDLRRAFDRKFGVKAASDETVMLRDGPGYHIGPHTDTARKVVTALFYVTKDWTEAEHGTTVYEPLTAGFTDPAGRHHAREGFKVKWTAPGKPGSMLAFARCDNSFHGAEPYTGKATRDILLFDTRS